MAFKDILVVLITYPEATSASEVQEAVSFAVSLDARISALACIVKVRAPQHELANAFIDIPALVASEMKKSSDVAADLLAAFESLRKEGWGVSGEPYEDMFRLRGSQFARRRSTTEGSDDCPRSSRRPQLSMVCQVDRLWFRSTSCNTSTARTHSRASSRHYRDCMGWELSSRSRSR